MAEECEKVVKLALELNIVKRNSKYDKIMGNIKYRIGTILTIVDPFLAYDY